MSENESSSQRAKFLILIRAPNVHWLFLGTQQFHFSIWLNTWLSWGYFFFFSCVQGRGAGRVLFGWKGIILSLLALLALSGYLATVRKSSTEKQSSYIISEIRATDQLSGPRKLVSKFTKNLPFAISIWKMLH